MASGNKRVLAWRKLSDASIHLQSDIFDSAAICSANERAHPCSVAGELPGSAILPRESAELLPIHAAQAQARLEIYNIGPKLMYGLIPLNPHIPYEPGYLERVAEEIWELREKIWAEKTTGVIFNQVPIHPRNSNEQVEEEMKSSIISEAGAKAEGKGEGESSM